jgi:hypothetical protein
MFDEVEKQLADYLERKLIWVQAPLPPEAQTAESEQRLVAQG